MPTTKERILITLSPSASRELKQLAKREKSPKATIAARLLEAQLFGIPTVRLSTSGERRALRAVRASKKAGEEGTLRVLSSLADLMN